MIYAAIMGHGVVGSGAAEVFYKNKPQIEARCHSEVDIKYILDLRDFPDAPYAEKFTKDFNDILNDDSIKVVAEVMGGVHPAFEFTKSLLEAGKSVVTSNKELVATMGTELLNVARAHNVNYMFEASVGGGIPIIRPINQCLTANDILSVAGILNGTTNFILTKMITERMSFDDALALAQALGYAEKDPTADVEGYDACRKICILAALAYGYHVNPNEIYTEGISRIDLADIAYAADDNSVIKLLGVAEKSENGKLNIYVAPSVISRTSQLSSVDDVFNAIMVSGDAVGDVMFYGRGAGKMPTASAVVADMIDCVKHIETRKYIDWADAPKGYVNDFEDIEFAMYVRGELAGELSDITDVFGEVKRLGRPDAPKGEIAFITAPISGREFKRRIEKLGGKFTERSAIRLFDRR